MNDERAVKRYKIRRDGRLKKRGVRLDVEWDESKHDRDESGKFTSGGASKSASSGSDKKAAVLAGGPSEIKVHGPRESKQFISSYVKQHPEIKSNIKQYKGILNKVKNFEQDNPGIEDGTYDAVTGKKKDIGDGFCVTFHQNLTADDPYGGYDDDDYAGMCAIAARELGADGPNIGYFGNAEISFNCKDYKRAMDFAKAHNQHSIYDVKNDSVLLSGVWDEKYNPIKGLGSNK